MSFLSEFSFNFYNLWLFSSFYFVVSVGLLFIIPKYNLSKFVKTPKIKFVTTINYILYYTFLLLSIFISFKQCSLFFSIGFVVFIFGMILYIISFFYFAISEYDKPVTEKIYKISRHPVYLSFFIIGIGISLIGASVILIIIVFLHFISTYFIMKEEEKMCLEIYGKEYETYMKKVRMII